MTYTELLALARTRPAQLTSSRWDGGDAPWPECTAQMSEPAAPAISCFDGEPVALRVYAVAHEYTWRRRPDMPHMNSLP